MFAIAILVVATTVLISHLAISYKSSRSQHDRVFAFMAAKSILAEVQAFASADEDSDTNDVDNLDDGATPKPTLSIATDAGTLIPPDHELSGNWQRGGQWVWARQITVRPLQGLNNRKLRYVSVRILKINERGKQLEIANLSSVVNSLAQSFPSTQVFDVYFLAIENIPGWWVHMETIRPFMEAMVTDLERGNPGLKIRSHWITKASYGRNQVYRPYINQGVDSHTEAEGVYYYPGLMPAGNASSYYYVPGMMTARMRTEAGEINGYDANLNPFPYALADFFNHGMRYPQEKAFHERRVQAVRNRKAAIAAAKAGGTPVPPELWDMSEEPTYRMLLEDMCTDPNKYKSALVINLHGELVPMPSIRNYSDPAKTPADFPELRVVTHAEELRTKRDPVGAAHDDVKLRVYAWTTDPDTYAGTPVMPVANPIVLQVMGVDLADGTGKLIPGVEVQNLRGGVTVNGTTDYFPFAPSKASTDALVPNEMFYWAGFTDPGPGFEKYTVIALYNTPVVAPLVPHSVTAQQQGLANTATARLYDMEYIPTCTGAGLDFSHDLASPGVGPKNTARWTIKIPGLVLTTNRFVDTNGNKYNPTDDVQLTVRTRIYSLLMGDWFNTGRLFPVPNEPENLSETYTWWADSREDVPFTERSQFLGDPRYNPYKDLLAGDPDFSNGYNWFFDSLQNTTDVTGNYPGLDSSLLRNRWESRLRQDVPRYFEMFRTALVRSGAIYNSLTGWSYYYMGHGAEIGYDSSNGYPNSIPTILTPFGNNGSTGFINNLTANRRYVRGEGATYWWGMPWLGELCPDSHYLTQWLVLDVDGKLNGNLAPGVGANLFYQDVDETVYQGSRNVSTGTSLLSGVQRMKSEGCGMFFNIGSSGSTFNHTGASGNGNLVGAGLELSNNYNMFLPASTAINRPFSLAASNDPEGWNDSPYVGNRFTAALIKTYYTGTAAGFTGSGLVELTDPGGSNSAYIVVNGLAQTTTLGTSTLAKYSLLSMVHSYFESGDPGVTNRIEMTPRVEIQSPTEITEILKPTSVDLKFDIQWRRWDNEKYTASRLDSFSETDGDIEYLLMYSKDSGKAWFSVVGDKPVEPGTYPDDGSMFLADTVAGPETHTWLTPAASFPGGSYMIRIEAYRQGQTLHYSNHQKKIFIER